MAGPIYLGTRASGAVVVVSGVENKQCEHSLLGQVSRHVSQSLGLRNGLRLVGWGPLSLSLKEYARLMSTGGEAAAKGILAELSKLI